MDNEAQKMLDFVFYREVVLEIILSGEHIARAVYELRFKLFLRAFHTYFNKRNSEVLEPFPPCFFDCVSKQRRYDDLESCVSSFPKLSEIQEDTSLPELAWELLHWIFTNPLKIKNVEESPVSGYFTEELRKTTQLMTIPCPSYSCQRFEITHPIEGANSTKVFLKHKGIHKSFYAYHGSPVHNFHSIIHRGLRCSLNVRSAYGTGVYLSSSLDIAISYACDHSPSSRSNEWTSPDDDIAYCIAIVEVIKHPSIKVVPRDRGRNLTDTNKFDKTSSDVHNYYVVDSDELMRLKHLIVCSTSH